MTPDNIREVLKTAADLPENGLEAAVASAAESVPAVITVAQSMVDGRLPLSRIQTSVDHSEDPQLFIDGGLIAFDDPVGWVGRPVRQAAPDDPLSEGQFAGLDLALWRRLGTAMMCLSWTDRYLSGVATGPERMPRTAYLPAILGMDAGVNIPQHGAHVAGPLVRPLGSLESGLAADGDANPFINRGVGDLEGSLWADGYLRCVQSHETTWLALLSERSLTARLIARLVALVHDDNEPRDEPLTDAEWSDMIAKLPLLIFGTRSFWGRESHPPLEVPRVRATKVAGNDPRPCGASKKFKRSCGAVA